MNTLALVAFGLLLVAGALLLVSFFGLRICVQRFARSHDLHFAGFIQRPYWLLFAVALVFMVPPFVFGCLVDDDGNGESLLDLLIGSIFASGAIGFVVSLFWMAIAGFLSLFRQLKFKH
jgi:Na+/proline symporter